MSAWPTRSPRQRFLGEVWVNEKGLAASASADPSCFLLGGLDLNQRPLGYEGKSNPHRNQDEPTQTNDDEALLNGSAGLFGLISVGLLHSTFIASRGGPTSGEIDAGGIDSITFRAIQPGRHRVAKHDQERGSRIGGMVTLTIRSS